LCIIKINGNEHLFLFRMGDPHPWPERNSKVCQIVLYITYQMQTF